MVLVGFAQFAGINQANVRDAFGLGGVDQQFVNITDSPAATAAVDVFEFFEAVEMHPALGLAPTDGLAHLSAGEQAVALFCFLALHGRGHHGLGFFQQPTGLGRQFVEAATEDLGRDPVYDLDVFNGDGQHLNVFAAGVL